MRFAWETISDIDDCETLRAKVHGGWIVRTITRSLISRDYSFRLSESGVFIADPDHEWEID